MRIARRTVRLLGKRVPIQKAYLFGSYVDGTATNESDIDIAVFSPRFRHMPIDEKIDLVSRVQMTIGAEIELHPFPSHLLREARPTNFIGHITKHGKKIAA